MWQPERTRATREDVPAPSPEGERTSSLWLLFAVLAVVVAGAGYLLANAGVTLSEQTGLPGTTVGALLTGVATSLPELVTTLAAVRLTAGLLQRQRTGIGFEGFAVLVTYAAGVALVPFTA